MTQLLTGSLLLYINLYKALKLPQKLILMKLQYLCGYIVKNDCRSMVCQSDLNQILDPLLIFQLSLHN